MNVDSILDVLREVVDPELGVNVVDLGLVYGVEVDGRRVRVRMTLTSPACPLGALLRAEIEDRLRRSFREVESVRVDWVWDPPWRPERMSEAARRILG